LHFSLIFPIGGVASSGMARLPSEITPAFTTERLQVLAGAIARVRRDALDSHQPEKGDNAWSFGCVCYVRTCAALSVLEASREHPWLQVDVEGLACTILIEGVPIKFYKGDAERPSDRSLRLGLEQAILQGKLAFLEAEHAAEQGGWFWLMAIETHEDGTVARIAMLQTNRVGEIRDTWFIPFEDAVAVATSANQAAREGVDLPPPVVGARSVKVETSGGDEDEDGSP
jgi:hypothetical protein